jgi:hypothetical protein
VSDDVGGISTDKAYQRMRKGVGDGSTDMGDTLTVAQEGRMAKNGGCGWYSIQVSRFHYEAVIAFHTHVYTDRCFLQFLK